MTTPGSRQETPTSPDQPDRDPWAESMEITTSETVSPVPEFQYSDKGAALRAENASLQAKLEEARATEAPQPRRRGRLTALIATAALGLGGGGGYAVSQLGGDREPGAEPSVSGELTPGQEEAPVDAPTGQANPETEPVVDSGTTPSEAEAATPTASPEAVQQSRLPEALQTRIDSMTPENLAAMSPSELRAISRINIADINPDGDKSAAELAELYAIAYTSIETRIYQADIGSFPRDMIVRDDYEAQMIERFAIPMYTGLQGEKSYHLHEINTDNEHLEFVYNKNANFQITDIDSPGVLDGNPTYEGFEITYVEGTAIAHNQGDIANKPLTLSWQYNMTSQDRQYLDPIVGNLPAFVGVDWILEKQGYTIVADENGDIFFTFGDDAEIGTTEMVEDRTVDTP